MKLELLGDVYKNHILFKNRVCWTLWLNEDYIISSGQSVSKVAAERQATKAFESFKRNLNHRKKPIRFQEWA